MPLNKNLKSCGDWTGPIVIGQAAEFDYAGTGMPLLKEEGLEVVLVNSDGSHDYDEQRHCGSGLH